jgi:hypothetical protein
MQRFIKVKMFDDLLIFRGRIIVNFWTLKSTLTNDTTTAIPTTPSPMQ